jgi:hypothetical protein
MARKGLDRRAVPSKSQKSAKRTTDKVVKTQVKASGAKQASAAPAKTLKRAAETGKKSIPAKAAVPDKKAAAALKKPVNLEKKPAVPEKKPGDKAVGKKGLAVKAGAAPAATKVVKPKVRKPRAKKAPPRMRVRWCVYDGMMKPVAMFDYNQRKEAEASLAQYLLKKPTYFLQPVKELMPLPPEPPEAS